MNKELEKADLQTRFDFLLDLMGTTRFLQLEIITNEIPFFICPFTHQDDFKEISSVTGKLKNRLENKGVSVLSVNLYDLVIEILNDRNRFEQLIKIEPNQDKTKVQELLQGMTDPERHLVPLISKKIAQAEYDLIFIEGIGEVFPYIRVHNVLENLQKIIKRKPMVLFFPGSFEQSLEQGASLNLFGQFPEDKYYRANNIYHYQD